MISGTPRVTITTPKVYSGSVIVRDAAGTLSVAQSFSITINPTIRFNITSLQTSTLNTTYMQTITTGGGTGVVNVSYTLSGLLPNGLAIDPDSPTSSPIVISGTPTKAGSTTITLTAVDSLGATTRITYMLVATTMSSCSPGPRVGYPGHYYYVPLPIDQICYWSLR